MIRENASAHEDVDLMRGSASKNSSGAYSAKQVSRSASAQARASLPSHEVVKQCLVNMDLAIKMQMIIFDLSSTIWWSTVAEIFIFFYGLWVFFIDAAHMALVWMFIPHVVRAILGLLVIKKMPTMHDMVSCVTIPPNEKIPLGKIDRFIATGAKESIDLFM